MARIVFTESADTDTAGIQADLLAIAGQRTALKYDSLFESLYDRLAEFPGSGAPRPRLGVDVRIGIVSPYIVIYRHRLGTDDVTVLRVVHGRRKLSGALLSA